ncbi:Suppressor of RPS4-RLD 1 [Ranunculus cassubicifolius]
MESSNISERIELAKLCSSGDWSKAIRILDSILSRSSVTQDICNRAFCYSQLELNKHVIKDCDKAMELEPTLLQPYILKGHALSSLGKEEDALLVWEQGHGHAVRQSADLKQLLELEELLARAKRNKASNHVDHNMESSSLNMSTGGTKSERVSNGTLEISSKSIDASQTCNNSSVSPVAIGKSNETSESHGDSSSKSEVLNGSSDMSEVCFRLSDKIEIHTKSSEGSKRSLKILANGGPKTTSISLDLRLSRGISRVNEGNYAQAISIFDKILKDNPTYPEALIGRGTAYAFQRELHSAITDFTEAIKANPSAGEAWKRRGQARAALGESVEAIEDLTKALEFEPNSSDILHERGIVYFKFKDYNAAVQDLSSCLRLDKTNKSAYTYLGLALCSIGEHGKAEEAHMKAIQLDKCFVEGWIHFAQFYQDLANSTKALECIKEVLQIDERSAKAYHLRGLLFHGMGEHRNAIKDLSIGLSIESSNIECLYLRASCYHAIAEYKDAVKDYDTVLDLELDSMDKFVLQCLAFYQKEIALYTASKFNSEFCWFDIDGDIDPLFKEYWCKRLHPKFVCERVFRQPPLRNSIRKGRIKKQDFVMTKQKSALLQAADLIGKKIQYDCPGFLSNRRQHRMAGLAAIEIAQKVSKAWRSLNHANQGTTKSSKKARRKERIHLLSQNRGGAGCSTSSFSDTSTSYGVTEDRSSGSRCVMSWRDVYALAVKWRQISEPCDPVVWVNKLSEEFNAGFGSHTPLIIGQGKVVRYFPNYQRVLNVAKTFIQEMKYVNNTSDNFIDLTKDGKVQSMLQANSCSDLYNVVGEDFWLATWCNSAAFEGKRLEGTRITLQKMGEQGFDFSIRTPCTPSRWEDYDAEMTLSWEAICNAYCGETYGSTDLTSLEDVRNGILKMTYYWYNFMPLSRGTAIVGYTVLLGLFLAANMEITQNIPQGLQVDWEAILTSDPTSFIESIKIWMYQSLKITSCKDFPDIGSTLATTGSVIASLSNYD